MESPQTKQLTKYLKRKQGKAQVEFDTVSNRSKEDKHVNISFIPDYHTEEPQTEKESIEEPKVNRSLKPLQTKPESNFVERVFSKIKQKDIPLMIAKIREIMGPTILFVNVKEGNTNPQYESIKSQIRQIIENNGNKKEESEQLFASIFEQQNKEIKEENTQTEIFDVVADPQEIKKLKDTIENMKEDMKTISSKAQELELQNDQLMKSLQAETQARINYEKYKKENEILRSKAEELKLLYENEHNKLEQTVQEITEIKADIMEEYKDIEVLKRSLIKESSIKYNTEPSRVNIKPQNKVPYILYQSEHPHQYVREVTTISENSVQTIKKRTVVDQSIETKSQQITPTNFNI